MRFYQEIAVINAAAAKFRKRWPLIAGAEAKRPRGPSPKKPSNERLDAEYRKICAALNANYAKRDALRTAAELELTARIRRTTRLQCFTAVWIGNFIVDIFFPQLASLVKEKGQVRFRGLSIESDGGIHNGGGKIIKDTHKRDFLASFGIISTSIENCDLHSDFHHIGSLVAKVIAGLPDVTRLDYRARVRLWRMIHLITIAYHASDSLLNSLYGYDHSKACGENK